MFTKKTCSAPAGRRGFVGAWRPTETGTQRGGGARLRTTAGCSAGRGECRSISATERKKKGKRREEGAKDGGGNNAGEVFQRRGSTGERKEGDRLEEKP